VGESTSGLERRLSARLSAWFATSARDLPWRREPRDPYAALVAEVMLQQTQVSRVVPAFGRFLERFPTLEALAGASEDQVLAMWSGLGYYRRARSLHAAARAVVEHHAGRIPADIHALRALPGIGRYTAGAIASIAFRQPAPIVDGNVRRVFLRVHGRDLDPADPGTDRWAWDVAEGYAASAKNPGVANEALMELGATFCLPPPSAPRCGACPVRGLCEARRQGATDRIPRARARPRPSDVWLTTAVVRDPRGRVLLVRRKHMEIDGARRGSKGARTGAAGLWCGLWLTPVAESLSGYPAGASLVKSVAETTAIRIGPVRTVGQFTHATSHRKVHIRVCTAVHEGGGVNRGARWVSPGDLNRPGRLGVSSALRRILMVEQASTAPVRRAGRGCRAVEAHPR
jgi:A/G-specific adenine glycosylase